MVFISTVDLNSQQLFRWQNPSILHFFSSIRFTVWKSKWVVLNLLMIKRNYNSVTFYQTPKSGGPGKRTEPIYIYICIHIFVHAHKQAHLCDDVRTYLRWICHACTVWDIPLPIHIPWTHHACTARDILQEWRDSRTLMAFDFFNSRFFDTTLDTVPINHNFCHLRVERERDWPPKGTCTTLRCRISLSSSIAVLAWHRTQLMDWMMMFFFFFFFEWSIMVFDEPNKSKCWFVWGMP